MTLPQATAAFLRGGSSLATLAFLFPGLAGFEEVLDISVPGFFCIFESSSQRIGIVRLFSQLGGVQSPRRCNLTVEHFEALGKIRTNLAFQIWEKERIKLGRIPRRRHAHMHTRDGPSINVNLAEDLEGTFTWTPPLAVQDPDKPDELAGPESISMEELEAEFDRYEREKQNEAEADENVPDALTGEVYDFTEFEIVQKGAVQTSFDNNIDVVNEAGTSGEAWDIDALARI